MILLGISLGGFATFREKAFARKDAETQSE